MAPSLAETAQIRESGSGWEALAVQPLLLLATGTERDPRVEAVPRLVALRYPTFAVPNVLGTRLARQVILHRAVGKRRLAEARDSPCVLVASRPEHQPRAFKRLQTLANRLH